MTLRYPIALLLFVPLAFFILRSLQKPGDGAKLSFPLLHRNISTHTVFYVPILVPLFLRALGFAFLIFCLARPQTTSTHAKKSSEGIDIMLALDVSESMLLEEEPGTNRITVAKQTVANFIKGRSDDRIGFLIFSGSSLTLCPPTLDYDVLLDSVDLSNVNILKDGTAIGDALATAANRLKDSTAKSKIIILLTDGDSNTGSIAPLTAGEIAAGYGIKVYSIAFGRDPGSNGLGTINGQAVATPTINPELIRKIAIETGGKFYRAQDSTALKQVFKEINSLEKNKKETRQRTNYEEEYQPYLLLGFLFLLAELIARKTIFRVSPE